MSEYIGYLTGNRGTVTRNGSVKSGISAHIKSWYNDVYASLYRDQLTDKDVLYLKIPKGLKVFINSKEVKINE